jgi:hypothetical protein
MIVHFQFQFHQNPLSVLSPGFWSISCIVIFRISAGHKAYFAHKMLFMSMTLSKKSKLKLYNSVIWPIVTYTSETWVLKKQIKEKLLVFERKIIRRIYGATVDPNGLRKRRTNEEINILLKQRNIVRHIKAQRLAWLGHLERMHE